MNKRTLIALILLLLAASTTFAAQSSITEADGTACMGDDKSKKQTEQAALTDAKRKAVEQVSSYLTSESKVVNFVLEKDLLAAYTHAEVKLIQEVSKEWYKDPGSGDCFKMKIKAEVIPDTAAMEKMKAQSPAITDDPSAPLMVKAWTDKKEYKHGDKIKVYIMGNKPFYARVLYRDAAGETIQLLPNAHRSENYFNGGTMYEVPTGNDPFELEVSPPFGDENVIVYASTSPVGEISTAARGGIIAVKTSPKDLGMKTRSIKVTAKLASKASGSTTTTAEFFEDQVKVTTGK